MFSPSAINPQGKTRRRLLGALLALGLALLAAEALWRAELLAAPEHFYSDLWFRLAGRQHAVERVALVKLDEATLADHPDEPLVFWGPHFAQGAAVLRQAGASVVAFDMLFSASPEQWLARIGGVSDTRARNFDQAFRQQLASGQVIVAGMQAAEETLLPAPDYLLALPDFDTRRFVGAADLTPDADGVLRTLFPSPPGARGQDDGGLLSLSFLIAAHASGQPVSSSVWHFGGREVAEGQAVRLAYAGPPGSVPALSLRRLLAEDALQDPEIKALRGKAVIVGGSYGGMNDAHVTPYGRGLFDSPLMLGAEIQAQMVEALLQGRFLDQVPPWLRQLLACLLVFPAVLLWQRQRPLAGLFVLVLVLLLAAGAAYLAFCQQWLLGAANLQAVAILAFAGIYGWRFTHGELERERLRTVFSRYVEPNVVEALLASGQMPQLGGEQRVMTVLFSDIRNFTTISEQLSPVEVVEMLNNYFGRACAVLAEEGACIDKFIGDAIMAEFGVPLETPDHARRAIRAAIRLRDTAAEFSQWMAVRFAGRNLPHFAVGIGLHTGPAVVGNIGAARRMEYTVIGDSVNLASRLEGMTKNLNCVILASQDTLNAAGGGFALGRSANITVKGRSQPVDVWEITGFSSAAD